MAKPPIWLNEEGNITLTDARLIAIEASALLIGGGDGGVTTNGTCGGVNDNCVNTGNCTSSRNRTCSNQRYCASDDGVG